MDKEFFKEQRVCFVTNTNTLESSPFIHSFKSYSSIVSDFRLYPAIFGRELVYGLKCFYRMVKDLVGKFDYIIYIDDDAFLIPGSEGLLLKVFKEFQESGAIIAGVPDGGVICHRNHNSVMVNTFVSFWNLKKMRDAGLTKEEMESPAFIVSLNGMDFSTWREKASAESAQKTEERMEAVLADSKKVMEHVDVPYANVVMDDPTNICEPHQVPWSAKLDDFEPYYKLVETLLLRCDGTIWHLYARDKVTGGGDDSGLTSEIYTYDESGELRPVFWHTWFSRSYSKLEHQHERINSVIEALRLF